MEQGQQKLKYLCIIDEAPEVLKAVHFAARKAKCLGHDLYFLRIVQPVSTDSSWAEVREMALQEQLQQAELLVIEYQNYVRDLNGLEAQVFIKHGNVYSEIQRFVEQDPLIAIIILGSSLEGDCPGPLVSYFSSAAVAKASIPIVIVPGSLTIARIDQLT